MKRIYTVLLCILPLLAGCNLDLIPENALMERNAFDSETELAGWANSINLYMSKSMGDNYATFIHVGEIMDETVEDGVRDWSPFMVPNQPANGWGAEYDIIFLANSLLDNIHLVPNLSEERKNYYLGQAEFALGFSYYSLARKFGDAVITLNSQNRDPYPLSSKEKVIQAAIDHATKAFELLPVHSMLRDVNGRAITQKQYGSKGTAATLLAYAYAWQGAMRKYYNMPGDPAEAYTQSVKYASEVIDGKAGNYQLCANTEELVRNLSSRNIENPEEIFSFVYDKEASEFSKSTTPGMFFVRWPVDKTATLGDMESAEIKVYMSTIRKLYPDPKDTRMQSFFFEHDKRHMVDNKDLAIVYKWRDAIHEQDEASETGLSFRSLNANYVYWRLADLILLRAEAYAQLGNEAQATQDLNTIRARAQATPYPSSFDKEKTLQKAIFREREKELIFEGHRYFDVVRNGYTQTELQGKFAQLTPTEIANGALYLPIPKSSYIGRDGRVINPFIRQNAYWAPFVN